jgi:hypothetical protein
LKEEESMATRAETFRSEQARQRAHEAASSRQDNHGPTEKEAVEREQQQPLPDGVMIGSGGVPRGAGGRAGRRSEQRTKDAIPRTATQMHVSFSPSARHQKRT